ncbi:MAG: formylglycine-generating enzyme family protein [Armatimonadota bacterium]
MGSADEDIAALAELDPEFESIADWYEDEKPQHNIHLSGYWIYKNEVTGIQYRKFCEETNKKLPGVPKWIWKTDHPILMVSWQDAVDYASWAGVSLPTEAQWEKAARGTDSRIYPWGDEWDASECANAVEEDPDSTQPVGSYTSGSSPYGCMDMAGNVFEWCVDWYDPNCYRNSQKENPSGPVQGIEVECSDGTMKIARIMRGGSWSSESQMDFRCTNRAYDDPLTPSPDTGFRCVKNL